jgi:hypothetical protein
MRRRLLIVFAVLGLTGALVWRYQSELIGIGARWYLDRVAAREAASGKVTDRRLVLAGCTVCSSCRRRRAARARALRLHHVAFLSRRNRGRLAQLGRVSLQQPRPRPGTPPADGEPRLSRAELEAELQHDADFFALRKRPDVPGVRFRDLLGKGGESYTVEEIEQAAREGRQLDLR